MDAVRRTQLTVGVAGIVGITSYLLHIHSEQPLVHLDAVRESRPFIEGVEGQFLDEREPIHQNIVAFGSELHILHFLASHDWSHIGLVHAHDPVWDALAGIAAPEVVVWLAVHCRDDCYRLVLPLREKAFLLPHLLQYLAQQVKKTSRYLPGLALRVLALLAVRQVRLLHIQILRPRTMDFQLDARLAHHLISLLYALL